MADRVDFPIAISRITLARLYFDTFGNCFFFFFKRFSFAIVAQWAAREEVAPMMIRPTAGRRVSSPAVTQFASR